MMNEFSPFDPLKAKAVADTEVAVLAQKREIRNILNSYVGWWDPFSELIQNSLDALDLRMRDEEEEYEPTIWIKVDIQSNTLTVTDNGIGLNEEQFTKFLCPDISFKSGKTRGHKGVGATYLAYGFNFIQVGTKVPGFEAVGKMENARNWLNDENPSGNPQVSPDKNGAFDSNFKDIDRGVSVFIEFDKETHPKDLKWIVTEQADQWFKLLSVKTGLGAFHLDNRINVNIEVVSKIGEVTTFANKGIQYLWTQNVVPKAASIRQIISKGEELFAKKGPGYTLPASLTNLDAVYEQWSAADLLDFKRIGIKFDDEDLAVIKKYEPEIYVSYVYSVKVWDAVNKQINVRSNQRVLYGGIQLVANNMPQGETFQIPLVRNIGRQNQIHCVFYFHNCNSDLGRKGFQSEVVEFAKDTARKIAENTLNKVKYALKANTGIAPNLMREVAVESWKREMEQYEAFNKLDLINENFFLPLNKISITSEPTREQDVIALFNQLIAGGVIRGIRIMSTNERSTYDGLYRAVIEEPKEHHIYDRRTNPLGIERYEADELKADFLSHPRIVEYKYSLDGLIEDMENGSKNSNEVDLIVVWETGSYYKGNYKITSLLDEDNLSLREYHGVTHTITNLNTGQKEMNLIVLSELIDSLNYPEETRAKQIEKYED